MKHFLFLLMLILFSATARADDITIALEKAPIQREDMASVQRGAKFFATVCMSCHTLVYLRYNKLAQAAGVVYEKMPISVKWPEGSVPPDLSLEASIRGVDWLYTYLHSFYTDKTRPTGVNNLLVTNTMMPAIVAPYQGSQTLTIDQKVLQTLHNSSMQWYDVLTLVQQGTLSPAEFDATTADVVNFLAYASEPYRAEQRRLGRWVLGYLFILFILVYLLKREYWKDVR
jgi:ubiquinol-cytochrome c reductase cytochrome c1 subunit